jgi:hypothetical protein
VLSRKIPYYQYGDVQITAVLMREEPPKRPGLATTDNQYDTDGSSDESDEEQDWNELNDELWGLIARCCTPQPGDRPTIPDIQKLIADMKIEDSRTETKGSPIVAVLKRRFNPEVDFHRVAVLLTQIQVSQSIT